jgi:5-methylcytosine-specific restriction endonuclease McrA
MATAAPRPCAEPGCPLVVTGSDRCPTHERVHRLRERAMNPRESRDGGPKYDSRWQKARAGFLAKHTLCVRCGAPSSVLDHITPHHGDWKLFWMRENWQPLCKPCHDRKTTIEDGRYGFASRPETMRLSKVPLVVVSGPPGAGKSLLVSRNAGADDLVVDLDVIKAELSGLPLYHAPHAEWMKRAMGERNRRLLSLCETPSCPRAWLITSAPAAADRRWWRERAGARTLLVVASPETCRARVLADERRPLERKAEHLHAIDSWFARYTVDAYGDEQVSDAATATV